MNNKDLKILHLISSGGFFGAENVIVQLCKETLNLGAVPMVGIIYNIYNPHSEIVEILKPFNITCKIFNCRSRFDLNTILEIRKFIKEKNINIIHSHGYKSNLFALLACYKLKIKKISTIHNWLEDNIKVKFYNFLDKNLIKKFDYLVVVSQNIKKEIMRLGVAENKIYLIPNGVEDFLNINITNDDLIKKKIQLGIHEQDFVIGTIGRISKEKGQEFLILSASNVIKEIPNVKFIFIGDGPLRLDLERKAKSLGIEQNVIFTGVSKDIPLLLNIIDIFVLPSIVEAMPMALLEAMISSKPIIATRVGEIPSIIKDGINGILVNPKDSNDIANKIIDLIRTPILRDRISKEARKTALSNYSSRAMTKAYFDKVYYNG